MRAGLEDGHCAHVLSWPQASPALGPWLPESCLVRVEEGHSRRHTWVTVCVAVSWVGRIREEGAKAPCGLSLTCRRRAGIVRFQTELSVKGGRPGQERGEPSGCRVEGG